MKNNVARIFIFIVVIFTILACSQNNSDPLQGVWKQTEMPVYLFFNADGTYAVGLGPEEDRALGQGNYKYLDNDTVIIGTKNPVEMDFKINGDQAEFSNYSDGSIDTFIKIK